MNGYQTFKARLFELRPPNTEITCERYAPPVYVKITFYNYETNKMWWTKIDDLFFYETSRCKKIAEEIIKLYQRVCNGS